MTTADLHPRSHHWTDWDGGRLLDAKRRAGTTVSLVLPARDEAATIGDIVARVRKELVEALPLVDEIVVIDSDSSDATAQTARDAGATVHAAADIRPDLGHRTGKGEAMWKSLFVTKGDVLVFMDADLTEWDTHFVTGLLGPLLTEDDVQLVKGFYDRPMAADPDEPDSDVASEGGRVTELVARPLISLHWPELAGVVQPLAGEWAVRRTLLEQLSLPSGYAVELAVLVDTFDEVGTGGVAQVDLGVRRHGHQPIRDLGVMALEIVAMAEKRLAGFHLPETLPLQQYAWTGGTATPVVREVGLHERPPALTVPGYTGHAEVGHGAAS